MGGDGKRRGTGKRKGDVTVSVISVPSEEHHLVVLKAHTRDPELLDEDMEDGAELLPWRH